MFRKVAFALVLVSAVSVFARSADAQSREDERTEEERVRETPPALSIHSGRTLAEGERAVVVGAGWPGLYGGGVFAPSRRFDIGAIGRLLMGSPVMGLPLALGFDLSAPMRIHLMKSGATDLALAIRPYGLVGRASLVGLEGEGENWFGYGFGGQGGARVGHQLNPKTTIAAGVHGSLDFLGVPNADRADLAGTITGMLAFEGLFTRATMFFFQAEAGYGFAPESYFDTHLVLRASIGFAHTAYR